MRLGGDRAGRQIRPEPRHQRPRDAARHHAPDQGIAVPPVIPLDLHGRSLSGGRGGGQVGPFRWSHRTVEHGADLPGIMMPEPNKVNATPPLDDDGFVLTPICSLAWQLAPLPAGACRTSFGQNRSGRCGCRGRDSGGTGCRRKAWINAVVHEALRWVRLEGDNLYGYE